MWVARVRKFPPRRGIIPVRPPFETKLFDAIADPIAVQTEQRRGFGVIACIGDSGGKATCEAS